MKRAIVTIDRRMDRLAGRLARQLGEARESVLAVLICRAAGVMPGELKGLATRVELRIPEERGLPQEELNRLTDRFIEEFREAVPGIPSHRKECVLRLKRLFEARGAAGAELVIEATRLYLAETEPRYTMLPHYFISKGSGSSATHTLEAYMERLEEEGGLW